ncbi:MAG TPA: septum formation family protein [Nocardioidaceae bacterium]|nr:septum formation family protein [Nocardioidaceae bacterium]
MLPRLAVVALLLPLTACGEAAVSDEEGPVEAPALGACRVLDPEDIAQPINDSETVDCSEEHTAETFAVGDFPEKLTKGLDVEDPELGAYIYNTCNKRFQAFLGGDESTVMRSMVTWAWFRPARPAWEQGARWYRCDVVGGTEQSEALRPLPKSAKGLLSGPPDDDWMTCADGETVSGSEKVPCSEPHTWRAVTTIKVGREEDPYPGDRLVEVATRDFCSDSVGAWMNYPVDYEFGYTYFREAEWKAGNRRSICWARTDK